MLVSASDGNLGIRKTAAGPEFQSHKMTEVKLTTKP